MEAVDFLSKLDESSKVHVLKGDVKLQNNEQKTQTQQDVVGSHTGEAEKRLVRGWGPPRLLCWNPV